jgi:hypothetical protein
MKTNIVIILIAVCVTAGVGYYTYELGKQAGIKEAMEARTTFFSDPQRFPAASGSGATVVTQQGGGQRQGGQTQQGPQGQGGQAAQFAQFLGGVQGTVEKVEGNRLTVSVQRGQQAQTVKVTVSDATTVQVQNLTPATVNDVKVGARILVGADNPQRTQGQPGQGGAPQLPSELTARSIIVLPANTP